MQRRRLDGIQSPAQVRQPGRLPWVCSQRRLVQRVTQVKKCIHRAAGHRKVARELPTRLRIVDRQHVPETPAARLERRLREIAAPVQFGRHTPGPHHAAALAQAVVVVEKKEGLVPDDRPDRKSRRIGCGAAGPNSSRFARETLVETSTDAVCLEVRGNYTRCISMA